jgi:uncharacterized membrane protein
MDNQNVRDLYARKDLDRLIAFSDGVFAVAITLLALNFKVPTVGEVSHLTGRMFGISLAGHSPFFEALFSADYLIFFGYVVSFLVVGMYWIAHHRVIRYITRIDSAVLWFNILLLMFLGMVPFTTLLINTSNAPLAFAIYAANQGLIGCMQFAIWYHASSHRKLIDADLSVNTIKVLRLRTAVAPIIFLITVPLAYVNPALPMVLWIALFAFRILILNLFPSFRAAKVNPEMVRW